MNSLDLIKMAFQNLLRRRTRTVLTLLGVIIGTSSIVIMLSLGIAMDANFKEQLSTMGSLNIIQVHSSRYYGDDMGSRNSKESSLDDSTVSKIEKVPGVEAVMPIKTAYMKMGAGKMVGSISVIGIKPELLEAFDFKIGDGRLLLSSDKDSMIFGKEVARNFYNPRLRNRSYDSMNSSSVNLLSNKLILTSDMNYGERKRNTDRDTLDKPPKPHNVRGVGLLETSNSEKDYNAYMNIHVLKEILKEDEKSKESGGRRRSRNEDEYEKLEVKVADINLVEKIQDKIKVMGFETFSLTDMLKSMKKSSKVIQGILGGIGGVSLFVAAIGITNTMVMSIYERTREIGVMKVLGANLSDIKKLFLLEAGMIGFGGGMLGLIFSYTVSFGLNKIGANMMGEMGSSSKLSIISLSLALLAVVFSTIVGIISGYSPARRAMNLSALEAIKTE